MDLEIERKFLLKDEGWRAHVQRSLQMLQGYLLSDELSSMRIRIAGDQAWLTIKGATKGVSRTEYEYVIPVSDAKEILATLRRGPVIEKTRHYINYGDHLWEIDEFAGDNAGLIVAEVEMARIDEKVKLPDWRSTGL